MGAKSFKPIGSRFTMRKLPVIPALTHAFKSVWDNRWVALRMSWIWYVILAVALAAGSQVSATRGGGDPQTLAPEVMFVEIGMILLVLLVNSSFAVHWHRYILLDEVPGPFDALRLDGKVWRYFGNSLAIIIGLIVPSIALAIPFVFVAIATGASQLVPLASMISVIVVVSICFLRLGLKLPAIALGIPDFRFIDAWRASAGNSSRVAALFLITLSIALVASFVVALINLSGGFAGLVVGFVLQLAINWFLTFFAITLLTSLYGFFVQNRDF